MTRPKLASSWLGGCSGCHMSFLDMDERLLEIFQLMDVRATPFTDLKQPDQEGVEIGLLEGGINNSADEETARQMRARCKTLVALGDCAVFGAVPAMRNFFTLQECLERAYIETESTDQSGSIPKDAELCSLTRVRTLQEVIPVDVFLPGCPPSADSIYYVLKELVEGRQPQLKDKFLDWG